MTRDDKMAGGWHLVGVTVVALLVWEIGGLLGWWRMAHKRASQTAATGA